MDRALGALNNGNSEHLEQGGVAGWADVEATVVVGVVDGHRVVHGVLDVLVGDAVLARRRMDLHQGIVIRNLGRTW